MSNLQQIISLMAQKAPHSEAMDWDNVGLQVGDYNSEINKILVALDINEEVIEEAVNKETDLIITHHPLLFNGIDNIHNQTAKGRILMKAIKNDIAIYSAHTNMDIAKKGLNDYLADKLGIIDTEVLSKENEKKHYKLAVYVPKENAEVIKEAMFKKGAGQIGNYSKTSFSSEGVGTFLPGENSNPHLGKKGEIKKVDEMKIETIVPQNKVNNVIKAMLKTHPYEEVAYDVYEMPLQSDYDGIGRVGYLKDSISLKAYSERIKTTLNIDKLKVRGNLKDKIKKVALCSGAGADFISLASSKGADLYITGDVKYHEAQLAEELKINLIDAGHFETEVIFKEMIFKYLQDKIEKNNMQVELVMSEIVTNPWQYL